MNVDSSDRELMEKYSERGCETAFSTITQRHAGMVYATALRTVKDRTLAEEVTQNVFSELARRIHTLATSTNLPAWLHTVAYRKSVDALRKESRHRGHEPLTEMTIPPNATTPPNDWHDLAPLLDEAMHEMEETDRTSLILRYFENQPLKVVGQRMGVSEDAAQKRVSRALEQLRCAFAKRQRSVETGTLSALMMASAAPSVSQALVTQIITSASMGSVLLTKTAATAVQVGRAAASSSGSSSPHLLWSGLVTVALILTIHQSFRASQLARELEQSRAQAQAIAATTTLSSASGQDNVSLPPASEAGSSSTTDLELRRDNQKLRSDLARLNSGLNRVRGEVDQALALIPPYQTFKTTTSSTLQWNEALIMKGWTLPTGKRAVIVLRVDPVEGGKQMLIRTDWLEYEPESMTDWDVDNLLAQPSETDHQTEPEKVLSVTEAERLLAAAKNSAGVQILSSPRMQTSSGVQASLSITDKKTSPSGEEYSLGPSLNVVPNSSADGQSVELRILAELSVPNPKPEIHWP